MAESAPAYQARAPGPNEARGSFKMAKKSRGGRMTAAKKRAAKKSGGKGKVKSRKAGKRIMAT